MEVRTRYGRLVKKPELFVPQEVPEDDFSDSDYDEEESDVSSEIEYSSEEESESEGSLKDFVVREEETDDDNGSESDSE